MELAIGAVNPFAGILTVNNKVIVDGEGSVFDGGNQSYSRIGGTYAHSNLLVVANGGMVTNMALTVGGWGHNTPNTGATYNGIIVTNGGILSTGSAAAASEYHPPMTSIGFSKSTGDDRIGRSDYNYVIVRDPGSVWDMHGRNLAVGFFARRSNTSDPRPSYSYGRGNSLLVENGGVFRNALDIRVGYFENSAPDDNNNQLSVSNSVTAASGGSVTASGTIHVGQTGYEGVHGNRIITAGGKIKADNIYVASTNGIGAVLGGYEPVPIEATVKATFEADTYVYPSVTEYGREHIGGVIFTAPEIEGWEHVEIAPDIANPERWRLFKSPTEISLFRRNPTVITVR